jgi:hypothetical protein
METTLNSDQVPVESEEHAILWCGLYKDARCKLFEKVLQISGRKDVKGKYVQREGLIDLQRLIMKPPSSMGESGVDTAMRIILGGLRSDDHGVVKMSKNERQVHLDICQASKQFISQLVQLRRQWHRSQVKVRRSSSRHCQSGLDVWLLTPPTPSSRRTSALTNMRSHRPRSRHLQRSRSSICPPSKNSRPGLGRSLSASHSRTSRTTRTGQGSNIRGRRGRGRGDSVVRRPELEEADVSRQLSIMRYMSLPDRLV